MTTPDDSYAEGHAGPETAPRFLGDPPSEGTNPQDELAAIQKNADDQAQRNQVTYRGLATQGVQLNPLSVVQCQMNALVEVMLGEDELARARFRLQCELEVAALMAQTTEELKAMKAEAKKPKLHVPR